MNLRPRFGLAVILCISSLLWLAAAARAATEVDLELVLAVDASGSVDDGEFALQLGGIAAALRDPEVLAAIRSGPTGRIAVTLAVWAEANRPKGALPWRIVSDASSLAAFAREVETAGRMIPAGGTGIGKAIWFSVGLIERNGIEAPRRVIDISGDGRETAFREWSVPVGQARQIARSRAVTVNGLAILNEEPDLEAYYRAQVIVGAGAFTLAARTYEDFAAAMRRKLIREIEYQPEVSQDRPTDSPARLAAGRGDGPD